MRVAGFSSAQGKGLLIPLWCVFLEIESLFAASFLHLALDVFDEISVNHIVPTANLLD